MNWNGYWCHASTETHWCRREIECGIARERARPDQSGAADEADKARRMSLAREDDWLRGSGGALQTRTLRRRANESDEDARAAEGELLAGPATPTLASLVSKTPTPSGSGD